jgi:hypothetical protein
MSANRCRTAALLAAVPLTTASLTGARVTLLRLARRDLGICREPVLKVPLAANALNRMDRAPPINHLPRHTNMSEWPP